MDTRKSMRKRAFYVLLRAGFITGGYRCDSKSERHLNITKLLATTDKEFMSYRGVGEKTLVEIISIRETIRKAFEM